MENFANDLVSVLQYLLPGFISAWVFYSLTSYPKPSQFERVVQALIFTLFVRVIILVLHAVFSYIGKYWSIGEWTESVSLTLSVFVALALGLVFSYFANNDRLHKAFRDFGITRETSFPSEWFGAFLKDITFVVLHFKDERRLYGWPIEWPSEPNNGYFVIADPSWVTDDGKELRISGVKNILVNVNDIKWVEFMEKTWEKRNG